MEARLLAGRLAGNLGNGKLGQALLTLAWCADRDDPEATYRFARTLLQRRGPLRTWQFLMRRGEAVTADHPLRPSWLALHAHVLASLRDFERAEHWMTRAEEADAENPWLCVERSIVLRTQDRFEEALEAASRALVIRPWFRPGIQATADGLRQLARDEEALALLRAASDRLESGAVTAQLVATLMDRRLYGEAAEVVERLSRLSPLASPDVVRWLNGLRSDIAYHRGDLEKARVHADAGGEFFRRVSACLAEPPAERRQVLLDVPFVRQHHLTCGPATLASIGPYWSMPVEHLKVVQAICYDVAASRSRSSQSRSLRLIL